MNTVPKQAGTSWRALSACSGEIPNCLDWLAVPNLILVSCRVITLSTAVFWQTVYAVTVRYRAAIVGVVYAKALRLASHASTSG